ncbi:hypothetical protein BG57_16705 [Caballeronia grimmiae]|uniref:Uncharacterized protein n=1 Tax=Caballeronia grimmiae TaxID=1071679 RepID=A0A069PH63_9BURK|nr:hypothetical protein BG57_16705 [Caballeronia grimmiae]
MPERVSHRFLFVTGSVILNQKYRFDPFQKVVFLQNSVKKTGRIRLPLRSAGFPSNEFRSMQRHRTVQQ